MAHLLKLSIVFLNYNRLAETRYTLAHLHSLVANRDDIEIIAIDNGSSDGTREFLHTQTAGVNVICLDTNTGIAGYNAGFEQARGHYVLVLDDDSHPVDTVTLDRLIEHLDTQPQVGAVACRIENVAGEVVHTWHLPKSEQPCLSMAFVGCGFAIRRDLFADIGWYPAAFFLYQNEIEVAIQVLRRHYQIIYDPRCRVIHRQSPQGRTTWRRVYYPTRNTLWLIRRYFSGIAGVYLMISRLSFGLIRAIQSREFKWYYRAVREGLTQPIESQALSPALRQQLTAFWRQNSIWHQLTRQL